MRTIAGGEVSWSRRTVTIVALLATAQTQLSVAIQYLTWFDPSAGKVSEWSRSLPVKSPSAALEHIVSQNLSPEYPMTTKTLVRLSAGIEAITGVALIASPTIVVRVLLGAALSHAGIAVGHVGGFALLSLAIACWPRNDTAPQAIHGLFIYNLLAAFYFGYLKLGGAFVSYLLLPACLLHLVLTLLLARPAYQSLRHVAPAN